MNQIVWLASYPKSGNTWCRAFLANLLGEDDNPALINEISVGGASGSRSEFERMAGVEASDLTPDEVDELRPAVYRAATTHLSRTDFRKIHDARTTTASDQDLIPADVTAGALYIVRNPLDVAPSYAHHAASSIDWAVTAMCNPRHAMAANPRRLDSQLRQRLLTWSGHVTSWLDDAPFPVELVRYEDLKANPLATFTRVARAGGLDHDEAAIAKAIEHSSFDNLKAQEAADGFGEKNPRTSTFFRRGEVGSWRESLTDAHVEQLLDAHGPTMERLGYLTDGAPTY